MDFSPSQAQLELASLARRIVADKVTVDGLRAAEAAGSRFDRDLLTALAGAGILTAACEYGLPEQCGVLVELGRALAPVPYLPTIVAGSALARFGTADQRRRWLEPSLAGHTVLAVALAGPDLPVPRAEPAGDGWRVTGELSAVTAGPIADAFLIGTDLGTEHAVFVVLPVDPGVTVDRQRMIDHDDAGLLTLDGVTLPADRLLGAAVPGWLQDRVAVGLCAYQYGVLAQALDLACEHARTRVQFGRPIGAFQAVGQRLADAYIDVEAVGLALWNAADALENGAPDSAAAVATAAFWAADAGHRVAHTVVHVHGGTGIDVDHPVHRYFLAAKRTEFSGGGATAPLRALGAVLAGRP